MAERVTPEVRLYHNPWTKTLADQLVGILRVAALEADEKLAALVAKREARESFACVLLDPTRPRWQDTPNKRTMAGILLGPDAEQYLPYALAKADAHDRHGCHNGFLVAEANFCLGDEDFAWGDSASYVLDDSCCKSIMNLAPAGGSGLKEAQDHDLTTGIVMCTMRAVHRMRSHWLVSRREDGVSTPWFNSDGVPGAYAQILSRPPLIVSK